MAEQVSELREDGCFAALTEDVLQPAAIMDLVRSPQAGAIVLFSGTTRDNFGGKPVKELQYSAYKPMALRTMMDIAKDIYTKHSLKGVAMIHRLGTVPIGEESILIAVSSPHRKAAWNAGEEALEEVKSKVEIWKQEMFHGEEGVWRANRDGAIGERIPDAKAEDGLVTEAEDVPEAMGPVVRPRRPGEHGHGAVVNPKPILPEGGK